jgi:transcriptional regulator with XRE-family HTH domain
MRSHRKKSALTLSDIANLLGMKDNSYISRIENGQRPPTVEVILLYSLLFDAPIDELFISQMQDVTQKFLAHSAILLKELQVLPESHESQARSSFIQSVITKITDIEPYED